MIIRPIRVVIADDERLAREALRILLESIPDIHVVAECDDGRSAAAAVESSAPDAVFLDIEMPGLSGFDVLDRLSPGQVPTIVFVTAYREHALRAFDVDAVDYILKPLRPERVLTAVKRARERMLQRHVTEQIEHVLGRRQSTAREYCCTRVTARRGDRSYFIELRDVDWIEARGNYVRLHVRGSARSTGDTTHVVRTNIGDLARHLDPARFLRIHRSTIVNLERIDHVRPYGGCDYEVVLTTGQVLHVARSCRDRLLRVYQ